MRLLQRLSVNDPMTKGRAAQVYETILANYSTFNDKEFQNVLRANFTDWVFKVAAQEPPGSQVPVMSLQHIHFTQPPLTRRPSCYSPHHKCAAVPAPPFPFRAEGPDLWYQMRLGNTTVGLSLAP